MSEIRCPMCGKLNPAEAEVCQYCQARLKPLWSEPAPDGPGQSSPPPSSGPESKSDEESIPDWLRGLRSDAEGEHDFSSSQADEEWSSIGGEGDRQLPVWLKDVYSREDIPLGPPPASRSEFDNVEDEDPDWLRRIGASDSSGVSHENLDMRDWSGEQEPASPDWQTESSVSEEPLEEKEEPDEGLLELAADSSGAAPEELAEEPVPETPDQLIPEEEAAISEPSRESLPDWLSEAREAESILAESLSMDEAPAEEISEAAETPERGKAPEEVAAGQNTDAFDFDFEKLSEDAGLDAETDEAEAFTDDLSWLDQIVPGLSEEAPESAPSEGTPEEETPASGEMDIFPDWLAETDQSQEKPLAPAFVSDETAEEIPSAELPTWLMAMRPVGALDLENASTPETSEQAEKAGPLAGLVGALPAEPDIIQSTKPPAYSLKLRVSDTQQAHADLLAQLVQAEGEVSSQPHPPIIKSQSLLRIIIGLILFAVVLVSLLTGYPALRPPPPGPDVFIANQLIDGLASGRPVLIVVDYSPGYLGEVENGLEAVVGHLDSRGNYLTLVSTNPVGPIQVEHLIDQLTSQSGRQPQVPYTNLGFLSGGAAGMRAFAQDPRNSMPYDVQGKPAWQVPQLLGVETLSDFAAVVIATENPEIATTWIEQVQPIMNGTPMIMVVSAQNAPIVRPYYDAYPRQVQGLVGGLPAAIEYDALLGEADAASTLWSPYAAALTAAVILILIGVLVNGVAGLLARSGTKTRSEGKA